MISLSCVFKPLKTFLASRWLIHSLISTQLAVNLLDDILEGIYPEEEKTIMTAEILHCIITHDSEAVPLTIEASVVRVADALDLTKGRAKIPFAAGASDTHAVSAMSIKELSIGTSDDKPIVVDIIMGNPAGLFHIEKLLRSKIRGGKLEKHIRVEAIISADRDENQFPDRIVFE